MKTSSGCRAIAGEAASDAAAIQGSLRFILMVSVPLVWSRWRDCGALAVGHWRGLALAALLRSAQAFHHHEQHRDDEDRDRGRRHRATDHGGSPLSPPQRTPPRGPPNTPAAAGGRQG